MATVNNFLTIIGVIPRSRFPSSHYLEDHRIDGLELPLIDDLNATVAELSSNITVETPAIPAIIESLANVSDPLPIINVPTIVEIANTALPIAIPGNITLPTCPIIAPINQNHTIFFLSNIAAEVRRQAAQTAQTLAFKSNLIGAYVAEQNYSAGNSCFAQTLVHPPINATFGLYDPAALAPQGGPSFLLISAIALASLTAFRVGLAIYQKYYSETSPSKAEKPIYYQNLVARLQRRHTTANVSSRHTAVKPNCQKSQTVLEFQKQCLLP